MIIRLIFTLLFFFSLCLHGIETQADPIKSTGIPYVQNFPKSLYQSGNQNWSVAKDKQGILYFGNTQGLLTYDGKYWNQYVMPDKQIVRSVAADDKGRIYTGAFGEFGYWSVKSKKLVYSSLTGLIPKGQPFTDEIWKIYIDGERVLFQSFSTIYSYSKGKITVIKAPGSFLFLQKAGNRFLIEVLKKGLYELKGNELIALPHSNPKSPDNMLSILPYKDGKLLIGTSKEGLFLYDGQSYVPFQTEANSFLKTFQLNNGILFDGNYYAFGTILNGLIILDDQGKIVQRINKSGGLQNNTVLSLFSDNDKNLWTGLDNGIDRVELNSPLYFYLDKAGQFGTVYSSIIYQNNIYLGTNQGLFYSPWKSNNTGSFNAFDFKLIPGSQGQVWDLSLIDGQLICGHNEGTFTIRGNQLEKISGASGGWTIKKLKSDPSYLIQGTYTGLVLFKQDPAGQWKYYSHIAGFAEPSRYVEQDLKGNIWVSNAYRGLYKLTLSPDYKRVIRKREYSQKDGLPSEFNINVFNLDNRMVFASASGFRRYDEISDRFSPYQELNNNLGSFASSHKIIPATPQKYWMVKDGRMAMVDFTIPGKLQIDSNRFSLLDGRMVQYYENISQISNDVYLVSVDDGFVIYDAAIGNAQSEKSPLPKVLIRHVEDASDVYRIISEYGNSGSTLEIPYNRNNIRISYALPYYRQAKISFQYYLEGYSSQWSDWNSATQKDFTNLTKGKYRFLVRAKINDQQISQVSVLEFTVLPPFYASNWALAFYFLLIIALLFMAKKQYETKLLDDRKKMRVKLELEKQEFLQAETEATEKEIIKIRTEKLQAELESKNRELASSAMSLVYKNELLQKLGTEIEKLRNEKVPKTADDQFRKIQKVIDEGMNDERDWNLFETSFNEAHGSFFKKLKASHPDLVPNDLKLCAYLHMNMSSKEMSSLLNISLRGVEIRRYRLRKKLNIPHDKNLAEFFMEL